MKYLLSSTLLLLALSPLAQANHNKAYSHAKVISTTPVYEYVVKPPTAHHRNMQYRTAHEKLSTGSVLGGVIGGVIGHTVSQSNHKGLGTIAGAIIGSTVGHQIDRTTDKHTSPYHNESRGKYTRTSKAQKIRVLSGYEVTYKYKGKVYQDFMHNKPSRYIKMAH